jgi:pimeloyl-ACP methyl ester carboxylesterase
MTHEAMGVHRHLLVPLIVSDLKWPVTCLALLIITVLNVLSPGGLLGGKLMARLLGSRLASMLPPWLLEGRPGAANAVSIGISKQSRKTLKNLFTGASQTDLPERALLASLTMPTLILAWSDDPAHPLTTAKALHLLLPSSTLVVAERYSDLEKWPGLIRQFVAKMEGDNITEQA